MRGLSVGCTSSRGAQGLALALDLREWFVIALVRSRPASTVTRS